MGLRVSSAESGNSASGAGDEMWQHRAVGSGAHSGLLSLPVASIPVACPFGKRHLHQTGSAAFLKL